MIRIVRSANEKPNPHFVEQKRGRRQGNLAWGEQAAIAMQAAGPDAWTYVALLGGADTMSFRARLAQAHLRGDMLPSYWSEAVLVLLRAAKLDGARAAHAPLLQPDGATFARDVNGVVIRPLVDFDDAERWPNIALIAVPIAQDVIVRRLETFMQSRASVDTLEHVLHWLAFSWGVARTGNPLHENFGLPSSCMLETLFAAEGFDLTPGLESRASCPEAIWGALLHWTDWYEKTGKGLVPFGRYTIGHSYPILELAPTDPPARKSSPRRPRSSRG